MKLAAVEQPAEHVWHLRLHDAWTIVLDGHRELVILTIKSFYRHLQVRQDAAFFARVETIVDGLLHGGEQCLARAVKAEQVAILGEELAHRNLALALPHCFGCHTAGIAFHFRPFRFLGEFGFAAVVLRVTASGEQALLLSLLTHRDAWMLVVTKGGSFSFASPRARHSAQKRRSPCRSSSSMS